MTWKARLSVLCLILFLTPCLAQTGPVYFILLTDPQFGMYSENKGFEQESANYEFAAAAVNRLKPGFVVVLGDLVNGAGDPAEISEYLRISKTISAAIPLYHVAGNHDVGNDPTPESIAAFRKNIGRDYYSFRAGPVYGIVLNSTVIHSSKNCPKEYRTQMAWLQTELAAAKASGAPHIVIFQHHPLFIKDPDEPDGYENLPLERRHLLLDLFRKYGVRNVFAGHTHRNVVAHAGQMEITATGPVGKPLGTDGSGIRVAVATAGGIEHRYFGFGSLPESLAQAFAK